MMVDDWNELMANIRNGDRATANVEKWDPKTWPAEAKGVGSVAAPRGALGHWIRIRNGRIENYQCVVPSTWNSSPRDGKGQIGAFEAALMNTPVAVADQPVEILRTLHSLRPLHGLRDPRDERGRRRVEHGHRALSHPAARRRAPARSRRT